MGILDYSKKKHPSGYKGIRLTSARKGSRIQLYAKQGDTAGLAKLVRIKKREDKLKAQDLMRDTKLAKPMFSNRSPHPTVTMVRGISLRILAPQGSMKSYRFVMGLSCRSVSGKTVTQKVTLRDGISLSTEWRSMCQRLADAKGLKSIPSHWILKCPTKQNLVALLDSVWTAHPDETLEDFPYYDLLASAEAVCESK